MKRLLKSAIIAGITAIAISEVNALTLSYTATGNVTFAGESFTFSKFDTSFGSLSAVSLIINSSVPGGTLVFTKTGATASTYTSLNGGLSIFSDDGTFFDNGNPISLQATPLAGNGTFIGSSSANAKSFSVQPGQSLISSAPFTQPILAAAWGLFSGSGDVILTGVFNALGAATGPNVSPQYNSLIAPTSLTLQYDYTSSAVPEPGQVAASLLLLGGIGGYVFIKRRRKPAVAAA